MADLRNVSFFQVKVSRRNLHIIIILQREISSVSLRLKAIPLFWRTLSLDPYLHWIHIQIFSASGSELRFLAESGSIENGCGSERLTLAYLFSPRNSTTSPVSSASSGSSAAERSSSPYGLRSPPAPRVQSSRAETATSRKQRPTAVGGSTAAQSQVTRMIAQLCQVCVLTLTSSKSTYNVQLNELH